MRLTARWTKDQDSSIEEPCSVRWSNGTAATLDDYRKHQLDTHTLRFDGPDYVELHMYPEIVAKVTFSRAVKDWVVSGPGIPTFGLELNNADAEDEQIIAELYTFPIVYRANIIRSEAEA
jgi:hypothetical protein